MNIQLNIKMKVIMKNLVLIIITLFLVACLVLWVKGNAMREINTKIEIKASPEMVWNTLTNINDWHKWNPVIVQASGIASIGSELTITMRGEDGKDGPKYMPIVTDLKEAKLFEWRAKMMSEFMFSNGRVFKLEKTDSGTRLTNTETFKGMLVPLFWSKLSNHVPLMLTEMNDALKNTVEKHSEQ